MTGDGYGLRKVLSQVKVKNKELTSDRTCFNVCHPEVFNPYINIQCCINQTQQNFIMFIIALGRHVSILIESSSGHSKNTDPYLAMFKMSCGIPNAYILDITMYRMRQNTLRTFSRAL